MLSPVSDKLAAQLNGQDTEERVIRHVTKKELTEQISLLEQQRIENIQIVNMLTATLDKRLANNEQIMLVKLDTGRINKKVKELKLKMVKAK